MPLVSYEDDESIDLFLRKQERAQRQQEREQRASAAQEIQDIDEPTEESGDFVTGVKAGFKQTQALGGGVKALAGSILGNEDMVKDGLLYYNEKMDEADRLGGNVTRVEDIESFGDSLDYMQYTLGTLVPDLLGGGLAGIAGKAAVKGVAKRTLKDAIDDRVQQAVADGAAEAGNKIALKKLRKEYEQEALGKIPQRAAIGGSALYSIGMNAGENFTEIEAETGKLDPVAALTVGVAQGALDSVGIPMRAFKKLFPDRSPEGLRTAIAEQLNDNRGAVRRIITESAKTAGAEGGIEALQEVMGRAAVAWANESLPESEQQEFFDIMAGENAQSLYINSLAAGFIGGSVIGGTVEGIRPKFDPADYDDRLGKMVEAKRAAKKAAAETDITPQEETIDLGEMPMDQESTAVYMGDMPAALQEQVFADGFEDDVVDIESVRQSVDKLEGIEQQRAKNALERLGLNQRQTRKVESPRQEVLLNFEGPIFTVSTPMTIKEKADELDQQVRSNTEKMQISGDDTFVAESISLGKLMSSVSVNRGGRPQLDSKTEGADPVKLETIVDRYGRPRTPEEVPEVEEVMSIQLDLLDRGMPRQFVSGVQGVYALEGDIDLFDDAPAVYFPANKSIGVRPETLTEGLENEQTARDNRYTMAHELWHLADSENDYSATLPDLAMDFADTDGDGIPDLSVGDVVAELYDQWEQQTDLGKGFGYPFNYLEKDLADAAPEERPAKLRAAQREVFAQLGAAFIANPKLLKDNAPNAYKLIKALRDNPSLRAEDIVREDNQTQADAVPTQPSGISGQVRAPPIEGSTEVQDDGGAGQASGVSPETGQTDPQLGEPEERDDGDAAGRVLRQKVTDFVASQGEVQGVSPIQLELRQGYNPTVELIDEMLADGSLVETIGEDGAPTYTLPQDQQVDAMRQPQQPITGEVANERRQRIRDRAERLQSGGITTLDGAPVIENATGPDPRIVAAAEEYAEQNGIPFSRQETYVEVSPERAARIAQAYDEMEHNPQDPAVKEAYDDLIRQTRDQYDFLVDAGYEFTFFDSETDPYDGNPWNAMRDLRNNQTMAVYGTYDGYGTEGITDGDVDDNPLLVDTGLRWKDQNGVEQVVTGNDLFRAVHDAFGHGIEGAGFRARGEENAWQAHARLFTGPGLAALTSETRGQNSWLNFGPFGEANRTASVLDTVFAEQKAGLMPEWTWSEAGPAMEQDDAPQPMRIQPSYKSVIARDEARNTAVKELENSGIGYDDLVGDFDIDELTVSPEFRRLLVALEREDYLGFDRIDDALTAMFDEDGVESFDVSPGFKSAFGRYLNQVNGFVDDSPQFIRLRDPEQEDISFNLNDDIAVDKSVDSAVKKLVPVGARRKLSDRLERLKELERRFASKLGLDRLPSAFSAYDNENLMHSKVQKQLEDFEEKYVVPIAEMIKGAGLEIEQAGLYLLAKHAPERNARIAEQERELREQQIAALEDQMAALDDDAEYARMAEKLDVLKNAPLKYQEKGSGLTNEEAESIIELADSEGKKESLESIASEVYQMLTDMRQNMVDQGLLDNRTREDWEETYQFYVPLKGFAAFPEGLEMKGGNGTQGFSIKGSESFKARGRVTLPVNPLTVAMKDAEEKIVRAEKNRTAQKLLKMFEKFQSPDNWRVYNQKVRPPRDSNPAEMKSNQEMRSERRPDDGLPRYIEVKRRGKSFFIEVRDRELNRQLQSGGVGMFNNQVDFMNKALTYAQSFQNFRRNMLINYNPSWGLVNPLRDIQTGLAFAISELDAKEGRLAGKFEGATDLTIKVAKSYTPSLKAFYRARRGTEGKTAEAKEFDQYTREYIEDGAPTGITITKSLEEQQERFKNIMGQSLKAKGINKMRPLFDWVEDANQTTENAARLATYIEARKAGVERADAATLAKDLTVNFNRKGEYSSAIDSLYLFFNAAIQGNVNILKALTRGKKEGGISKAQTLAASMVMFGFARTLANISMAGEDDDGESNYVDYNEYVMKTAMVFTDGRQGIAMPMPYGYGLLDNIGRFGAEMVMGIKTPEQTAVDLATSVDHHFNPMSLHATGDDRDMIEAAILKGMFLLSPDIGDFFIEQVANVNFFGSNIAIPQNPLLVQKPDAYMSKRGTNEFVTAVTEFLNDATGGSPYRSGFFDANPERVMHFYEFMMGGVGRFLDDSSDTVMKMISEEPDLLPKDIPIVRTFMPMASEFSDRVDFYSNRSSYEQYRTEYKESNVAERRALQQRFGARLYQFDVVHKNIEKQLRALSKQKKALYDDKVIDSMVRWKRLQAIAEQEERLFDEYNRRFNDVKP